jgi:hypothetical protein
VTILAPDLSVQAVWQSGVLAYPWEDE